MRGHVSLPTEQIVGRLDLSDFPGTVDAFRSACCRRIMLSLFDDLDFRADAHWTHAGLSLLLPEKEIHSEGFPFTTASEVKVRSLKPTVTGPAGGGERMPDHMRSCMWSDGGLCS